MSLWDQVTTFLTLNTFQESVPLQKRDGSAEDLLARITSTSFARVWHPASIREALGVPAIYRAVSLIANTMGALSMDAFRNGIKLVPDDRPRIIVRPDPFRIPREFFNQTGWNMATRGEAWWWVAARDVDDQAMSLLSIPPAEINVTENPRDLRYPVIEWRGEQMRNRDMIQIVLNREPGGLRGVGPLQLCGAAVSVSVEAQEWAADFFSSGGVPSTLIKSAVALDEDEAKALKAQWIDVPNNVPRVIDPSIESVEDHEVDVASKSMFEAREFQNAEAARMFGVPATLLETSVAGSSLTYQNLETEFGKFVRGCLWPNYLEPVEQTMSDLLTRSTVARFNVDALLRADVKTRYEVYKLGVADAGVLSIEEARKQEGLDPGDVEMAAMPFAPPQAVPSFLPIQGRSDVDGPTRCSSCGKTRFVIESREPLRMRCIRCKAVMEDTLQVREAPQTAPIVIPPSEIHFHEGAFKAGDVRVEAAPAPLAPQVTFSEGAIRAGDVHVPAAEEAVAAAERVDKAADQVENTAARVERMEKAYLEALTEMRREQPDFLAAMRDLTAEMQPKPVRQRIVRDENHKIVGVEPWPE